MFHMMVVKLTIKIKLRLHWIISWLIVKVISPLKSNLYYIFCSSPKKGVISSLFHSAHHLIFEDTKRILSNHTYVSLPPNKEYHASSMNMIGCLLSTYQIDTFDTFSMIFISNILIHLFIITFHFLFWQTIVRLVQQQSNKTKLRITVTYVCSSTQIHLEDEGKILGPKNILEGTRARDLCSSCEYSDVGVPLSLERGEAAPMIS